MEQREEPATDAMEGSVMDSGQPTQEGQTPMDQSYDEGPSGGGGRKSGEDPTQQAGGGSS